MIKRLQVFSDHKIAFINETKGVNVTPELEHVLTQLINLENDLIKFNKVSFQPSHSVYLASLVIKYSKTSLSWLGIAVLTYVISQKIIPLFF